MSRDQDHSVETMPVIMPTQVAAGAVPADKGFPIVGIGASAGGLAAFEAFFSAMPNDTESGMAFVLVQHLSPDHKSMLSELVKRYTTMRVTEVQDGMRVEPNCAYIIPPNRDMAFLHGTLQLLEPSEPRGLRLPIDFFFRSLAQDQHERAICIVLSGTGSDGTSGVRAIKSEGGMVMAQDPDSTEFDGMPRSAIMTGFVDYVLKPAEMPAQLIAYVQHAFGRTAQALVPVPLTEQDLYKKLCVLLRAQTGHDFSQYKQNTLVRRVDRRMAIQQIERIEDYISFAQKTPAELDALFRDLLIGVTNFFRDPEAFAALQSDSIPRLFAGKPAGSPVRVWVCGCSTGEEAYSLAILIQEYLESVREVYKVQLFATDIDRQAIEQARTGIFSANIAADVSPERLARYFTREGGEGGGYRIQKLVRDLIVFSEQDVIQDPPFSKLDFISCRNLLIYLNGDLQKKLMTLFHYALRPGGVLFLGSSESVGEFANLFAPLERKWKIYQGLDTDLGGYYLAPRDFSVPVSNAAARAYPAPGATRGTSKINLHALVEQFLLRHYAPASALVNGHGDILYIYGRTGRYLELAPGDAGMNILHMAREGLKRELATALYHVVMHKNTMRYSDLPVKTDGDFTRVNLTVRPLTAGTDDEPLTDAYLILFEETPPAPEAEGTKAAETDSASTEPDARILHLEQELRAKEEYLQATLEEMETANEELKSTNEEMQSVNEELQSTNEELETAKEELQSVNEELATVNAELQMKVADLSRANNDMNNLLAGTGIGTLFVDHRLRITRFTPSTTQLINLIQTDVGRPVAHIVSNLVGYDSLVRDVQTVLDTLVTIEVEVQTRTRAWFLMRIRPYRTIDNVIEGAVITFVDISGRKQIEMALRESEAGFAKIFGAAPAALSILRKSTGRYTDVNETFLTLFGFQRAQVIGKTPQELGLAPILDADAAHPVREHDGVREYQTTLHTLPGKDLQLLNSTVEIELAGEPHTLTFTLDLTARPART